MFETWTGKNLNYKFLTSNHDNVELILEIVHGDSTWKSNTGNVITRNSLVHTFKNYMYTAVRYRELKTKHWFLLFTGWSWARGKVWLKSKYFKKIKLLRVIICQWKIIIVISNYLKFPSSYFCFAASKTYICSKAVQPNSVQCT